MIPASFTYTAATSVEEAAALLAEHGDEAKILAGGQSLLPLLKLRLAGPATLVDLGRIDALRAIERNGTLRIGAMVTHERLQRADLPSGLDVIPQAAADIGDPLVRNRGTFGGSLAHVDPAGDWPAVALALDATVSATSVRGTREIPVDGFFTGVFTSALEPDEILTHVDLPTPGAGVRSAYVKIAHPASGYAVAAAAVAVRLDDDGVCRLARVALTGVGSLPYRATASEAALVGQTLTPAAIREAADAATEGTDVRTDGYAPAPYRANLAAVVTARALTRAVG